MHTPYTYLLKSPDGRLYYGLRYAKNCHPDEFWVTYFTSSKKVLELIEEYGKESFTFEIRKTFDDVEKAIKWESDVLYKLRVDLREDYINQSFLRNGAWKKSPEHKQNISRALINKPKSEAAKESMRKARRSEKYTTIARHNLKKAVETNTGKKRPEHSTLMIKLNAERRDQTTHIFYHIDGREFTGTKYQLKEMDDCVSIGELGMLIKGRYKSHKGWSIGT